MRPKYAIAWVISLGLAASVIPWTELTEGDWIYALATRFSLVDGHRVHYPTPTAELAKLLEGRSDPAALRHLAEARLSLGDRKGALETMERWAQAQGPEAWAETARWEASHHAYAEAFKAADKALAGLSPEAGLSLSDERIGWAEAHPDLADALALRKAKCQLFPRDSAALEAWLRALEKAGRLAEADQALASAEALPPERRILVRSDLMADHGDRVGAFRTLDAAVLEPWSADFSRAYARRVDQAMKTAPGAWRATLDTRFDAGALTRLFTYFQGSGNPEPATDLLRQMERRFEKTFTRQDSLLLSRLYASVDAVPEAFRAGLAAAHLGTKEEQAADLATLARLALRAGGRPLAWGSYNDESHRWVAAVDRTPGFWTGGLSFLLTGLEWKETLDRMENQSLPDRTFTTARALADTLAGRNSRHPDLPSLRLAIMARHVERGEGAQALALLPGLEQGPADVADEARHQALLAASQIDVPLADQLRLMKARMRFAAPDGSRPALDASGDSYGYQGPDSADGPAWARLSRKDPKPSYLRLLDEHISRLDELDKSHRASVDLLLCELDRLPDAEDLWLNLASRLENWNLDDGLGPRYQEALKRFQNPGVWDKAARWYARRSYHNELRKLADDVTARFRGSELFGRGSSQVAVAVPDQPPVAGGVRMVSWADLVRLKALQRFPHSPEVFREAGRLVTPAQWQANYNPSREARNETTKVIVPENLLEERRWAILFVDGAQREAWFAETMRQRSLEGKLTALEARKDRTPVEDLLLFEGWARLSHFERALDAGERLTRAYPGDGDLAQRVLSLHRSLNGLETSHAAPARALVERTAPALEDPNPLWTELGEMAEDRGRGDEAMAIWKNLLAREPRNPAKVAEAATLLWDYNHDREALDVVEAGRKAMGRPRFYAFETGVLRENTRDLEGAVREYLDATRPEDPDGWGSSFENDQRSLRRLAQLLARPRVYAIVEKRIRALAPGNAEDEKTLAAFFSLGTIETPDPGLAWDADVWIDTMDQPNDPVGRDQRKAAKESKRPAEFDAIRRVGDLLLDKVGEMTPRATAPGFLDFAENATSYLRQERWTTDRAAGFKGALMARRAQLAPTEDEHIRLEMERADYLVSIQRNEEADAVWAALEPRLGKLPEGSLRLKAESDRAGYLERSKGVDVAAAEWRRITARYPWSLALLEDRLAFLGRAKLDLEARNLLEETLPRAAAGHRETFLLQLTRESLDASDLPRARRAVGMLLAQEGLEDTQRLSAAHLMARLSFRENKAWDPFPLAKAQTPLLKPDAQADLYHQLARAADLEEASGRGVALWIEALNRRTQREWLVAAARSTQASGKGPELLAFFEKQRERSPRDMRWAVAVRDIKRFFHDVDGALEAAKAAVKVRPEQEILWQDAVELMVRADRSAEAADYLEGWNRARPASEDVARWRSELYARAGEADKALAIERQALKALEKEDGTNEEERESRRTRAAVRLLDLGCPAQALRLYSPAGDVARLAKDSKLPLGRQAEIALLLGQFPKLLAAANSEQLPELGSALARHGRPDQMEEVQAFLLRALYPIRSPQPDAGALNRWWPLVTEGGMETQMRAALAQRLLGTRPGPWQNDAPFPYVLAVGGSFIIHDHSIGRMAFREPDLAGLWARDLARRDRGEELLAFLEPRWRELVALARGNAPVGPANRMAWASWLDDPAVLRVWSQAAAGHPDKVAELSALMGERGLWDRFWALAAAHWNPDILLASVPEGPRTAWFRFWEPAPPRDPVLRIRKGVAEKVETLMARLIQGVPGTADDPLVARLRGPQTVGEVLGKDARWTWPEFALRRDAKGEIAEVGDDRMEGQGVDRGRIPGSLWGERPGEAWYVLEALARYRKGDATAPYLPLESAARGAETRRVLLSIRMARALGDPALAQRIAAAHPGPARDREWLEGRLSLLAAAGQSREAAEAFRKYVRTIQDGFTESDFKDLSVLASRFSLPAPMDCLDPARAVGPVFLAYLQDTRPESAKAFHTGNIVDYRTALVRRWAPREDRLTKAQMDYWLRELWATGSANLPRRALARLGPAWASAHPWLEPLPVPERPAAIASLEAALDPSRPHPALLAELTKPESNDGKRLLAVRLHLIRNEPDEALALAEAMVEEGGGGTGLGLDFQRPQEESGEGEEAQVPVVSGDAVVDRYEAWLLPFREARRTEAVEELIRNALGEAREKGSVSPQAWRLAFRLAPAGELPDLSRDLEEAWFRGDVDPGSLGMILETAAPALPEEAAHWMARWPFRPGFDQARERAAILKKLKREGEAARVLLAHRARGVWTAEEETKAFDVWRGLACPDVKPPEYWAASSSVWTGATPLGTRLKAHPRDVLSARLALRSLAPADENTMTRAAFILQLDGSLEQDQAQALLRLRAARGLLPQSAAAAQTALGSPEPEALARILAKSAKAADINASLADMARMAARLDRDSDKRRILATLAGRNAPNLKALHAELAPSAGKAHAYRMENGRPVPILPKDLTWAMLTNVLDKEGKP